MGAGKNRICPACRRQQVIDRIIAANTALPADQAAAAVDAAAASPAALRSLAHALADDPGAAHPRCHVVKPAAGRTCGGQPICERCRRRERDCRKCGKCGKIAPIAVQAREGTPGICANCYRMPAAVCSACSRRRECNFAASDRPVCPACSPRAAVACARCGTIRPRQCGGTKAALRQVLHRCPASREFSGLASPQLGREDAADNRVLVAAIAAPPALRTTREISRHEACTTRAGRHRPGTPWMYPLACRGSTGLRPWPKGWACLT